MGVALPGVPVEAAGMVSINCGGVTSIQLDSALWLQRPLSSQMKQAVPLPTRVPEHCSPPEDKVGQGLGDGPTHGSILQSHHVSNGMLYLTEVSVMAGKPNVPWQ